MIQITKEPLFVDFDDTDKTLRIWREATLVGELTPDMTATPKKEMRDIRWTGWLSSDTVVEIFGTYKTVR